MSCAHKLDVVKLDFISSLAFLYHHLQGVQILKTNIPFYLFLAFYHNFGKVSLAILNVDMVLLMIHENLNQVHCSPRGLCWGVESVMARRNKLTYIWMVQWEGSDYYKVNRINIFHAPMNTQPPTISSFSQQCRNYY